MSMYFTPKFKVGEGIIVKGCIARVAGWNGHSYILQLIKNDRGILRTEFGIDWINTNCKSLGYSKLIEVLYGR